MTGSTLIDSWISALMDLVNAGSSAGSAIIQSPSEAIKSPSS
ncbi:hypothetical protein [Speluncibacter jeojiensis]|uniref:Uncharacterized protein n=1 Tax=Speluncibacter jeojiensis TaxID=2710754 RepID=A0A9X4REN9_9ACTN|nr:hypothetical protein [Rhodococcus sp. D2-41]MDG3016115.1 hypothetical protein [Corynebacteriales bacterium D3-21]